MQLLKKLIHKQTKTDVGMIKNNEAFHFMASYAHVCLDFKDQI